MEKMKRVTLVDLAACCGLSKTAVGAILSHDPKYKVSPETKDMVLALARKMDYKPNLAAKALVSRKHYTVGMLFYSVHFLYVSYTKDLFLPCHKVAIWRPGSSISVLPHDPVHILREAVYSPVPSVRGSLRTQGSPTVYICRRRFT